MAKASETQQRPLILSPKAMNAALKQSANKAQRMAEAFGQKVPMARRKLQTESRGAEKIGV